MTELYTMICLGCGNTMATEVPFDYEDYEECEGCGSEYPEVDYILEG